MSNLLILTTPRERRSFLRAYPWLNQRVNNTFPGSPIDLATDVGDLVVLCDNTRQPLALLGMERQRDGSVLLNTATVLPEYRGNGYCNQLVGGVVRHPLYSGARVHLEVDPKNKAAVLCYRKAGFNV